MRPSAVAQPVLPWGGLQGLRSGCARGLRGAGFAGGYRVMQMVRCPLAGKSMYLRMGPERGMQSWMLNVQMYGSLVKKQVLLLTCTVMCLYPMGQLCLLFAR